MKNIIITGANSGLGFETAKKLAIYQDTRIILACRNLEKANIAKNKIVEITGNQHIEVNNLDLTSLKSVNKFAKQFKERKLKLYALINNAGISGMHKGISEDGYDIVFSSNHLGHFLLTNLLFECLEENGKIISVSSDMHDPMDGELQWISPNKLVYPDLQLERKRYSYSKLCNLYFIYYLAYQIKEKGLSITANAFNPGLMIDTGFAPAITKETEQKTQATMPHRVGNLEKSASALAQIIIDKKYDIISGAYFDRSIHTTKSSKLSYNMINAKELWDISLILTKCKSCI